MELDIKTLTGKADNPAAHKLKKWFKANRAALTKKNVSAIEAEYSGSGDSGQCNGTSVYMADERATRYQLPSKINDLLIEATEEVSGATGYENGDGGGGKLLLDVKTGKIIHQSYDYVMETHHNEDETL